MAHGRWSGSRAARCLDRRAHRRSRFRRRRFCGGAVLCAYRGGPALRASTFHERAGALKALAKRLLDFKEELYALSYRTGATKDDSWVDIDGGIGTVFAYREQGRARTAERPGVRRWSGRRSVEVRHFRRPAHLRAARGRGRAHQCIQFSGLGHAREARAGDTRGRAGDRQTCHDDRVSHRAGGAADRRVAHPARGRAAAGLRRASGTCSTI